MNDAEMALDFDKLIQQDKPVLVDFYATWCSPCMAMMPMLEALQAEMADNLHVVKIDVNEHTSLAVAQRVLGVPTLILFWRGRELWRHAGEIAKLALLQQIQEALAKEPSHT